MWLIQPAVIEVRPTDHPTSVCVIGDFNRWQAPGLKLQTSADGTVWRLPLKLEPDVYSYVVLENGAAPPTGDDLTTSTRQLIVTPPDYALHPAIRDDGIITASVVRHRPDADVEKINDRTYSLTLRVRKDDVRSITVAVSQPGADQKTYPLALRGTNPLFDYYKVKVVVDPTLPFDYRFFLNDGRGGRSFDQAGLAKGLFGGAPFSYPVSQSTPAPPPSNRQTS